MSGPVDISDYEAEPQVGHMVNLLNNLANVEGSQRRGYHAKCLQRAAEIVERFTAQQAVPTSSTSKEAVERVGDARTDELIRNVVHATEARSIDSLNAATDELHIYIASLRVPVSSEPDDLFDDDDPLPAAADMMRDIKQATGIEYDGDGTYGNGTWSVPAEPGPAEFHTLHEALERWLKIYGGPEPVSEEQRQILAEAVLRVYEMEIHDAYEVVDGVLAALGRTQ